MCPANISVSNEGLISRLDGETPNGETFDADGLLQGIFTDGDLRRRLDDGIDLHTARMRDVMISKCKTVSPETFAAEAVHILEQYKISALVVLDQDNKLVGALNIHDLFRAGVV